MHQLRNLNFLVICSILFLIDKTSALKCWRCSSDATNSKYCEDILDLTEINEQQKRWSYVECGEKSPQGGENGENLIAKCRIMHQLVNDVPTYTRSCYWEVENAPPNSCLIQNQYSPEYVKTIACNTCIEDGCNDKLPSVIDNEDNKNIPANNVKSSATFVILSNTIFAVFIINTVIGY